MEMLSYENIPVIWMLLQCYTKRDWWVFTINKSIYARVGTGMGLLTDKQ